MPTHTIASALIKFYFMKEPFGGAPWIFPAWQETTGVYHGLFDKTKLPKGWTPEMAAAVQSYFAQYQSKRGEDEKVKFACLNRKAEMETVPGRAFWKQWVTDGWTTWKIQRHICTILTDHDLHPLQIMVSNNDLDEYPQSTLYLPLALDKVGSYLFGHESLDTKGHLLLPLREPLMIILQRVWMNLKRQVTRSRNRLAKLEAEATAAFTGG